MKKLLSVLLVLIAVFGICVYANPVLDTAEVAGEAVLAEDDAETVTLVKGVKPGLNMIGQTSGVWSFEEADGMNNVTFFSGAGSVAANPLSDSVNSSALVSKASHTGAGYPTLSFALSEAVDGARPIYVTFKYYKDYTPTEAGETGSTRDNFWVMRNGTTYIVKSIGGFGFNTNWKQYSELLTFDNAYHASTQEKKPEAVTSILLEAGTNANAGNTNIYYDDIAFIPSYKITYMANDGTEEAEPVAVKYALLNAAGKMLTKYYIDKTVEAPAKEGYDFIGWATTADATAPVATVTLANEDIVLYAVWEEQPKVIGWDFETSGSHTWWDAYARTYRDGKFILDSETTASGYIGHNNDAVTGVDTSVYKYLVFNARSSGTVDTIKFYFSTSVAGMSEEATITVKINPNSDVFTEYVVDMSSNSAWTGTYKNCMLQINGGKGIVEFEDIYFASDVEKRAAWSFNGTKQDGASSWGHTDLSYDGNYLLMTRTLKDAEKDHGASDFKPAAYSTNRLEKSVVAAENRILVLKTARGKGPTQFQCYYITGEMTGITGSGWVNATKYGSDIESDYYVADFSSKSDYGIGMITGYSIAPSDRGTFLVDEIYVSDRYPDIEKAVGWDFESGAQSGFRGWGSYDESTYENGKLYTYKKSTEHGGFYATPSGIIAEENRYFVVKQLNEGSTGKPANFYPVGAYKAGIDGNLYMATYTTSYETPDGVYTYYVYDLTNADRNASDGIGYTGTVGQCCLTTSGECVWEDLYFIDDISDIIAECTVAKNNFTASATSVTTEGGTVKLYPYTTYENGWITDYTYELSNDNATIVEKTDGTAVLTAKYNGEVTVTMTANNKPATVYTHTVAISGQAPVYTVVYDANTTDEVTGMPEAVTVQTWDNEFTVSDAKPERAGYKFAGWSYYPNADYVVDAYFYQGDTTTMYALWIDDNTGFFRINKGENLDKSVYVNGSWKNHSDCVSHGGSILVPLTDGVGYVLVSDDTDIENATMYKVTADACEELDYVPAKTLAEKEARATGDTGIRFKANVAHAMRNAGNVGEYGFVVSTANQISDGDSLNVSLLESGRAVKGVAYSKADNIDKYVEEDDEGVIMAAVLTGVKADKKSYTTTIYVRPYMILDSGLEVYGLATSTTYYDVAKAIAETMPEDAPYADYINSIITTCEATAE